MFPTRQIWAEVVASTHKVSTLRSRSFSLVTGKYLFLESGATLMPQHWRGQVLTKPCLPALPIVP
jgi:hypothetical protein